ncbi:hypothetical protein A4A49_15446 [Nicotiana attenuata]|uniref:Uncharacterized protein n=1 Tax=Nicotiana attenuata TaxID=49451 RepID=A0A314KKC7_NICAT|nr:hypothetical protein A4A49_15446 [Nicotiana attenuata]
MSGVFPETKNSDLLKNPKYIRLKLLPGKDNVKQNFLAENSASITKSSVPSAFPTESQHHKDSLMSTVKGKNHKAQTCGPSENCNANTFRSVTDSDKSHGLSLSTVDMDKALRGLASHASSCFS